MAEIFHVHDAAPAEGLGEERGARILVGVVGLITLLTLVLLLIGWWSE